MRGEPRAHVIARGPPAADEGTNDRASGRVCVAPAIHHAGPGRPAHGRWHRVVLAPPHRGVSGGRRGQSGARLARASRAQMISRVIDFALHQRFVTVAVTIALVVLGTVSLFRLPIEAYPDVGDVKVEVITLWPGHAAEEVERLVTIPIENELNGIANVTFLRSDTLFGLSNIKILFADGTDRYWARAQAQERIAQASVPADAKPGLGPLSSVIGEVFRYTLESKTLPLVEVKAIEDWVLEREFKKVPGVADAVSWGGGIKQFQVDVDPDRLRAYNLALKQVFDAVSNNNSNAGSGFVERGEYRVPVRGIGLIQSTQDMENIVVAAQKGTPVRVRDIGTVGIGHAIRLGVLGRDHEDDVVQGIVLMRTGENP